MTKIFISYRRQDTELIVGRIHDKLTTQFGADAVFMDIDKIPPGVDFHEWLDREVSQASIVLALIGRGWLDARDAAGARRLDDENDFVRIEIEAAVRRGIPLVPVLIGGTPIPRAEQLPESLRALTRRNAYKVDAVHDFHQHMDRLIRWLEQQMGWAGVHAGAAMSKRTTGSSLEWSAAEWAVIKDSTDVARLKRFEALVHEYYLDEVRRRVAHLVH